MRGFDGSAWIGMVPAAIPKAVVGRLASAVHKVMPSEEAHLKLDAAGIELDYRPTEPLGRNLGGVKACFADIIQRDDIKIQ